MNETLNKSLSIRIATNGLSFCSYTPLADTPFAYREYDVQPTISMAANLKNALMNEPMLKEAYQRVNVLIATPHATYMPMAYFDAEAAEAIYAHNYPKDTPQHISYNVLRRSGVAIIFGVDRNIHQLLLDDFPRARFYASSSTLIEFLGNKSLKNEQGELYAYLHEKEMTVYAFRTGRLLCANTYDVTTTEDCMYYLLSLWKQLGLKQTEDALHLVGDSGREQPLADKIQNFLRHVRLIDRHEDFRSSITGGNTVIPYDLQTLLVCGF